MIKLMRVTLAITDMPAMVTFYNHVLDAHLEPVTDTPFYRGAIAGIDVLFCPNAIAGVDAQQNRQQFRFLVNNLGERLERITHYGGQILQTQIEQDGSRLIGVRDPDGNTLELLWLPWSWDW
jgi:predicted enzyme related to lactoylglutathione lyase